MSCPSKGTVIFRWGGGGSHSEAAGYNLHQKVNDDLMKPHESLDFVYFDLVTGN